ncbi:hypothetical protein VP01_1294g8 [Puccinia sorghi]|uniref:Retrovirus-related Pol polyprotein from transposon TNT 1-94-like beta-barrel domain-containing protein n=1 Tax=Puccinia sorghi TaxID=27349 RepID=A0A0L6VNA7_9BASI|nr:hypothetical protein VP01_1294g8 [Puccinia sorghi]
MSLVSLWIWINNGDPKSRIILDSGASAHIFNEKQYFSNLELKDCDTIKTGKLNATLPIKGIGNVKLKNFQITLYGCLPIDPVSRDHFCYILTGVDNLTEYLAGFPLLKKDDTTDVIIHLLKNKNKRLGYFPTWVCSDGGGEFAGNSIPQKGSLGSPWKLMHGKELPQGFIKPIGTPAITINHH